MTEEKDRKSESKEEPPKLNQEQYKFLKKCSKKGPEGIAEWNKWREEKQEDIWLQGAKLFKAKLQGANLKSVHLEGAWLIRAHLEKAIFTNACLEKAKFHGAFLQGANFHDAELQDTIFYKAYLQDTIFQTALINSATSFWGCEIDNKTNFFGVGLGYVRIKPGTKQLLEYNIRRMNWEDWYWGSSNHKVFEKDGHRPRRRACRVLWRLLRTWPVRLFWKMSDYGRSTGRIMLAFFVLAIGFAFVYLLRPCCVMVNNVVGDIRGFVHALYFSVVTMTTLGFGDIAANPDSWLGQVILMIQVILGYVLLGALVTRLAVLFTADGPAGSFTPMNKETKELLAKLK